MVNELIFKPAPLPVDLVQHAVDTRFSTTPNAQLPIVEISYNTITPADVHVLAKYEPWRGTEVAFDVVFHRNQGFVRLDILSAIDSDYAVGLYNAAHELAGGHLKSSVSYNVSEDASQREAILSKLNRCQYDHNLALKLAETRKAIPVSRVQIGGITLYVKQELSRADQIPANSDLKLKP